jgi:UDP-N-acetylglucosamine 1-carboxyvinyltransferase
MPTHLVIEGGLPLRGEAAVSAAKNAALPALAAALLTAEPVTLENLPALADVATIRALLERLGAVTALEPDGCTRVQVARVTSQEAPYELVSTMRASVLVLGPLLARTGTARVALPGGCAIGVRPIDQHLAGLAALGAEVVLAHGYVTARAARLRGARFRFALPTVTGTENLLMAATLARGTTVLENCAQEPEIADLARLLTAMGARIAGAGTATIEVEGVASLGGARHAVVGDRIEAGTYLLAAAITRGEVMVSGIDLEGLRPLAAALAAAGCDVEPGAGSLRVRGHEPRPLDVVTAPHPGFPTDLQAQLMALLTQARGVSSIEETVFENRFQHVAELARMGADIHVEGRLARVRGPAPLSGATVMATDLRASACLVLAGLAATGRTVVERIYHLDRGYAHMEEKLRALGGRVERVRGAEAPAPAAPLPERAVG